VNQDSQRHSVRRIVLPSGRSIEVVRFTEPARTAPPGLHVCPSCQSELVQPMAWEEALADHWMLTLECPNCGWTAEGVYDRDQIDRLEERLDRGWEDLLRDLKHLAHSNLAEEIDRFAAALDADQILPEDF
jgi:hypothetical protein